MCVFRQIGDRINSTDSVTKPTDGTKIDPSQYRNRVSRGRAPYFHFDPDFEKPNNVKSLLDGVGTKNLIVPIFICIALIVGFFVMWKLGFKMEEFDFTLGSIVIFCVALCVFQTWDFCAKALLSMIGIVVLCVMLVVVMGVFINTPLPCCQSLYVP